MIFDIDVVYDRHIIYYHNDLDSIVSAFLIKNYLYTNLGVAAISIIMEHGERYRLENISEDATLWVIGLDLSEEDTKFLNRYTTKVYWYLNKVCDKNQEILINFKINDDTTTIITQRIFKKYYGSNKFIEEFIKSYNTNNDFYRYMDSYIKTVNSVEEYFNKKDFTEYIQIGNLLNEIKDRIVSNIIAKSYIIENDIFKYYVINTNYHIDEIFNKLMKMTNVIVCIFYYNIMNDITVHLESNCLSLKKVKESYNGNGNNFKISFKTDTTNVPYLEIPNKIV